MTTSVLKVCSKCGHRAWVKPRVRHCLIAATGRMGLPTGYACYGRLCPVTKVIPVATYEEKAARKLASLTERIKTRDRLLARIQRSLIRLRKQQKYYQKRLTPKPKGPLFATIPESV